MSCVSAVTTGVCTPGELMQLGDRYGEVVVKQYLSVLNSAVELQLKTVPLTYSLARSNSSGGSNPVGCLAGRSGLVGSRLALINKVVDWRSSGASTGRAQERKVKYPDGLCYAKMLRPECADTATSKLGVFPTFAALMRTGLSKFQSLQELERFRLVKTSDDLYHVAAGGMEGVSFLDAACTYSKGVKTLPGTIGAEAKALQRPVVKVKGKAAVGGWFSKSKSSPERSVAQYPADSVSATDEWSMLLWSENGDALLRFKFSSVFSRGAAKLLGITGSVVVERGGVTTDAKLDLVRHLNSDLCSFTVEGMVKGVILPEYRFPYGYCVTLSSFEPCGEYTAPRYGGGRELVARESYMSRPDGSHGVDVPVDCVASCLRRGCPEDGFVPAGVVVGFVRTEHGSGSNRTFCTVKNGGRVFWSSQNYSATLKMVAGELKILS